MRNGPPPNIRKPESASPFPCSRSDASPAAEAGTGIPQAFYGIPLDPDEYQFICRDIYGTRFFLNARVNRGAGYFLTGKWTDARGTHSVCGIYDERSRTVSLTLEYTDSRRIMSQYTYTGNNRFAGVECNDRRNSFYEMSLYMEKGVFPGMPSPALPVGKGLSAYRRERDSRAAV